MKNIRVVYQKLLELCGRHKVLTFLLSLILMCYVYVTKPYIISNPENPLFKENQFSLDNYAFDYDGLAHALKVLFPVGTSKEYVDLMLVTRGGTQVVDGTATIPGFFSYQFRPIYITYDPWRIDVYYNSNLQIDLIQFNNQTLNGDIEVVNKRYNNSVKGK